MGKEIITLQLGQCGNQVGHSFWTNIANEHEITIDGAFTGEAIHQSGIDLYFQESEKRFSPRAILIDLEPAVLNKLSLNYSNFYRCENVLVGKNSGANCFANGFCGLQGIEDEVNESIRKETENCDHLLGFEFIHSVTGSAAGFGCKIASTMWEEYHKTMRSYNVYPSEQLSHSCTEAYNTLLCSSELLKHMDAIYVFNNEVLCQICERHLKIKDTQFADYNKLMSMFISTLTSTVRFPSQVGIRPKKIIQTLLPTPNCKFLLPSIAPLQNTKIVTPKTLTNEIFSGHNYLCHFDSQSKILSSCIIYRGCESTLKYDEQVRDYMNRNDDKFVSWFPSNVSVYYCDKSGSNNINKSACRVTCSSSIITQLQNFTDSSFELMKSGFGMHWYTGNGDKDMIQPGQFDEAIDAHRALIEKYEELSVEEEQQTGRNKRGGRKR